MRKGRMAWRSSRVVRQALMPTLAFLSLLLGVASHPLCLNQNYPTQQVLNFCTAVNENPDGSCCGPERDAALELAFNESILGLEGLSPECLDLHAQVICGPCQPWAQHLHEVIMQKNRGVPPESPDYIAGEMYLCQEFCQAYEACGIVPAGYCLTHAALPENSDPSYCYPYEPNFNPGDTTLTPLFNNIPIETFPVPMVEMKPHPLRNTWWVLELTGIIHEYERDPNSPPPVVALDLTDRVKATPWGEGGLAGLAFSPAFATTCHVYIMHMEDSVGVPFGDCPLCPPEFLLETEGNYVGRSVIKRFTVGNPANGCINFPNELILASEVELFSLLEPTDEHNCAWIGFRPDEDPNAPAHNLYIACGDGGPQFDPFLLGQDHFSPHGQMLRIEVSTAEELVPNAEGKLYNIPPDNPRASGQPLAGQGIEEGWAWGLRNCWRCAFDSKPPHALFCGDSSQNRVELIKRMRAADNFGWGAWEADMCEVAVINPETGEPQCNEIPLASITLPIYTACHAYWREFPPGDEVADRDRHCPIIPGELALGEGTEKPYDASSMIGGYVYRGSKYKDVMDGWYIFADWGLPRLMAAHPPPSGIDSDRWVVTVLANLPEDGLVQISAFGQDPEGEIYIVGYSNKFDQRAGIYEMPCGELCTDFAESTEAYSYIGCYYDNWLEPDMSGAFVAMPGLLTPDACADFCKTEGFNYFGLQQGTQCFCGDTFGLAHRKAAACNIPCDGNAEVICGGVKANSVYQVAPPTPFPNTALNTYLGCYKGNTDAIKIAADGTSLIPKDQHALTGEELVSEDTMTFEMCRTFCTDGGSEMFALERGTDCYCAAPGDEPSYFGSSSLCTSSCPSEDGGLWACGGEFSASVYLVGEAPETEAPTTAAATEAPIITPTMPPDGDPLEEGDFAGDEEVATQGSDGMTSGDVAGMTFGILAAGCVAIVGLYAWKKRKVYSAAA